MKAVTIALARRALSTPLVLHPASLAVGALLCGVVLLSMAQSSLTVPATLRVEYLPHPRDIFRIQEGAPYTVPAGKIFVLQGIGRVSATGSTAMAVLNANSVPDWSAGVGAAYLSPAPQGLTYASGTVLDLSDSSTPPGIDAYAVGYLVTK